MLRWVQRLTLGVMNLNWRVREISASALREMGDLTGMNVDVHDTDLPWLQRSVAVRTRCWGGGADRGCRRRESFGGGSLSNTQKVACLPYSLLRRGKYVGISWAPSSGRSRLAYLKQQRMNVWYLQVYIYRGGISSSWQEKVKKNKTSSGQTMVSTSAHLIAIMQSTNTFEAVRSAKGYTSYRSG